MSSNKPWALGWLADKEYFAELVRQLDLYDGPPDNWVKLQGAGIDHVLSQTGWPNIMECYIGGRIEMIFALYVDYKRRAYPLEWIPYSQLLPQKYPERLRKWVPLQGMPQWFPCTDGSYTPWRYANAQPDDDEEWIDVSYCRLFPAVENEMREKFAEAEDVYFEDYDEDSGYESEAFADDEDEEYYYEVEDEITEDGYYVEDIHTVDDAEYAGDDMNLIQVDMPFGRVDIEGGYRADDEVKTALSEDEDSLTVRGDPEVISKKATTFDDGLKRADDVALLRDSVIAPAAVSTDVSDDLSSVLRSVKL